MKKYLLPVLLILQCSCKKDATDSVTPATPNAPVDAITGTYIGKAMITTESFIMTQNGPEYNYDTTYPGLDTFIITRISADSFIVNNDQRWKYESNGKYSKGNSAGGGIWSNKLDFAPGSDSLYAVNMNGTYDKYGSSFGHYYSRIHFSGKKQ